MLKRREFIVSATSTSAFLLAGCAGSIDRKKSVEHPPIEPRIPDFYANMYSAIPDEKFPIPAVDLSQVPRRFWRRRVDFTTTYQVGTLIVDTSSFYLHLVQADGKAMRYGVGLGRQGFEWSGRGVIQWKQEWPKWTPPEEMIAREPELEKWSAANGGMPPGINNPLGARALYIFQDGKDTLYRIHGSPEYWTIGKAVSSGCVRLMNQDIIDLYSRVPKGAPLIVV